MDNLNPYNYCDTALAIVKKQNNEVMVLNGKPTELYYHYANCSYCNLGDYE